MGDASAGIVAGRYTLRERAGRGGMGEVWRATDEETSDTVAVKLMSIASARVRRRFAAEVETLRAFSHPAVVRYLDHGEDRVRGPFLVMEWLHGASLAERLSGGVLDVEDALALVGRLAEGLHSLHQRNVVHRDVKPENVILVDGDPSRPKLFDFGIALVPGPRQTQFDIVIGTPGHISPEQIRGEAVGAPADVFGLGVILYECLGGVSPFAAEHPVASFTKTLLEEPANLGSLRAGLDEMLCDLVHLMLAKDPSARPADAGVVAALLRSVLGGPTTVIDPPAPRVGTDERHLISLLVGERWGDVREDATLDEEEARIDAARLREVAERFGASVEMATGRAFAVTVPRGSVGTDAPRRAVRCALALREVLPHYGMAVATARARASASVGETIERAAALVPRDAEGSAVAVDDVTAALLDGRFVVEDARVLVELAGPPRARHAGRFVGREPELAALEALYGETVGQRSPRVAVVVGQSGSGKSRLASELIGHLDPPPTLAWARADRLRSRVPFAVAAELVALALGLRSSPSRATLETWVRAALADTPDVKSVLRFLPDLFGLPGDPTDPVRRAAEAEPALLAAHVRSAATALVKALAARRPVMLVIDDAHNADAPSMEWLDALARPESGAPVLVLALGLPEINRTHADRFARRSPLRLTLLGLSTTAAEELVRAQLEGVSTTDLAAIVAQGEGAPFHLEELVRARREGASTDSLLSMIETRITVLDAEARRVLRAASILGERFGIDALIALLGAREGDPSIAGALRQGVEADLIVPAEGAGAHHFRHRLVMEAAYAMLTEEDRTLGHRLAADHARERGGDAEAIAHHYSRAGHRIEAATWHERAALGALRANDLRGALRLAELAIADDEPTGRRLRICAEAKLWLGRTAEALELAEEALRECVNGATDWLGAASVIASAAAGRGRPERTEEIALALLEVPRVEGAIPALGLALTQTANHLIFAGRSALGHRLLDHLESLVEGRGDLGIEARLAHVRGMAATIAGDPAALIATTRDAIAAFEQIEDRRSTCVCHANLASVLNAAGMFEEAEREIRGALALAAELELGSVAVPAFITLAGALLGRGDAEGALDAASMAYAAAKGSGHVRFIGAAAVAFAQPALALGRVDEAAERLDAVIADLEGVPNYHAIALACSTRAALVKGDVEAALRDAEKASEILASLGALDEGEALVRGAHIEALIAAGRLDQARVAGREAIEVMERRAAALPATMRGAMRAAPDHARLLRVVEEVL